MLDSLPSEQDELEAARRQARQLASQGLFRDAVALGRSINRQAPDSGFECELRDWRHCAYYEAAPVQGPAEWPPRSADPFNSAPGQVPEIQASDLNGEILSGAMVHHGALLVRGLIDPARMSWYIDAMDKAFEVQVAKERTASQSHYDEFEPVHGSIADLLNSRTMFAGVTVSMVDTPHVLANWLEDIEACGALDAVSDYLGERPGIAAYKASLYRMPATTNQSGWHQDGVIFDKDIRTVNLWVAANECGIEAPGVEFLPWKLNGIVETGTEGSIFPWAVGDRVVERLAKGQPLAAPNFMPGDAILFDQFNLHRATARPGMFRTRYAIQSWLFAPSRYRHASPEGDSAMIWV